MANSPLVSIRIPPETLERVDMLAQQLYPSRRVGRNPNRSQVILAAIEQFLAQYESDSSDSLDSHSPSLDPLHSNLPEPEETLELSIPIQSSMAASPIQGYVDWWSDYFSYLGKLTTLWLGATNPWFDVK
jgi:predicted DNA-binding protein